MGGTNFIYFDLKQQKRGAAVEIDVDTAANVFLVDASNFSAYKNGRRFSYYGGQARRSPVRLAIPRSGRWYLVLDLGGYPGTIRHSDARILPGPMPPLRTTDPRLVEIAENAADLVGVPDIDDRAYDVFIAHASEDKDAIVRPLAHALRQRGLAVWYDEFEMKIGDNLRRKIDAGIANSRFGVVVLSHAFFAKNWSQYELDGLVTREMEGGGQLILPLWHSITRAEVAAQSPSLAGRYALQTAELSVEEIADQIADVIGGDNAIAA
jgi:hypothetical protein